MGTYRMYETQVSQRQVVYPAFSTTFNLLLFFFFVYISFFFWMRSRFVQYLLHTSGKDRRTGCGQCIILWDGNSTAKIYLFSLMLLSGGNPFSCITRAFFFWIKGSCKRNEMQIIFCLSRFVVWTIGPWKQNAWKQYGIYKGNLNFLSIFILFLTSDIGKKLYIYI